VSKLATRSVALLIVAAGLYAATSIDWDDEDDEPRSGKISCWWTPSDRAAAISWRFGSAQSNGSSMPTGASKAVPFIRTTKGTMRVGDVVSLTIVWPGGSVVGPGLSHECTVTAGHNVKVFKARNLARIQELVPVT
jgi:hypothetical protein